MLALTKKTDYALIALSYLARAKVQTVSARQIGERYSMPLPLLMNVLKRLGRSGLVRSVRGVKGGYQLAMPAEQITLAMLIEAMEGPVGLVQCAVQGPVRKGRVPCRVGESCPVRWPARRVHQRLQDFLEEVTLADMLTDSHEDQMQEQSEPSGAAKDATEPIDGDGR
jgi:Rrf2 family protein